MRLCQKPSALICCSGVSHRCLVLFFNLLFLDWNSNPQPAVMNECLLADWSIDWSIDCSYEWVWVHEWFSDRDIGTIGALWCWGQCCILWPACCLPLTKDSSGTGGALCLPCVLKGPLWFYDCKVLQPSSQLYSHVSSCDCSWTVSTWQRPLHGSLLKKHHLQINTLCCSNQDLKYFSESLVALNGRTGIGHV